MPDPSLSAAIKEAYASARADDVVLHTLEIWHHTFSQPIYVVRDNRALEGKIEAGAPRNAGTTQTFVPFAFDIVPPDVTSEGLPTCRFLLDNVQRVLGATLDSALAARGPVTITYRAYIADDADNGPETDPAVELTLMSVTATPTRVEAVAGFPDLLNRQFPFGDYDLARFPGLADA